MSGKWRYSDQRRRAEELAIWNDPSDERHGTANGYSNLRCRCERCTDAWRIHHTAWMNADPDRLRKHRLRQASYRAARARRKAS